VLIWITEQNPRMFEGIKKYPACSNMKFVMTVIQWKFPEEK
jgi:hypothetical protein